MTTFAWWSRTWASVAFIVVRRRSSRLPAFGKRRNVSEIEYLDREMASARRWPGFTLRAIAWCSRIAAKASACPSPRRWRAAYRSSSPALAALDFCHAERAYLIPARKARFAENAGRCARTVDYPFWAEPDQDALRLLLRQVVEHPAEAKAKGDKARAFMASHFTWDHAAASAERRLHALIASARSADVRHSCRQPSRRHVPGSRASPWP